MATVNIYLNFNGNTEEAFTFYKSVFGGAFTAFQRFKDTPEGGSVPAHEREKIMHVALPIGGGTALMGTDITEPRERVTFGTNFSISIDARSLEEATQLFGKLSVGGKATMPLEKMFWGAYFGTLTDRFGIQWMVNYNDQSGQ
jgi:PhnB protein